MACPRCAISYKGTPRVQYKGGPLMVRCPHCGFSVRASEYPEKTDVVRFLESVRQGDAC